MRKIHIFIYSCLTIAFVSTAMTACNEQTDEEIAASKSSVLYISKHPEESSAMETNYYIFRDDLLYKMGRGLASPFRLLVPENAGVYFYAGNTEPAGLAVVEIGKTTLNEFLSIRTDKDESPAEFYTGSLQRTEASVYNIPLSIGEAQIDLDATSSDLLRIKNISMENAPATTLLFPQEHPAGSTPKVTRTETFNPPAEGKKENIFRVYESNAPVTFNVEGEYDGIPLSFKASLPEVRRNTKYTLKVMNSGAEMTGVFSTDVWSQTNTVNTGPHADEKLLIDMEHSIFPEGTVVSESRQSLSVPYTGGDVTLAFMAESEVDFESIVDELSNLQANLLEVKRENDKILTKYRIHVKGQGENTLPYTTQLNVKSIFRQHSTSFISLIVECPPLYIREVTLGGVTWMAFNARSRNPDDQIYPMKGYSVEDMYKHEWLSTLGGMFQYRRNYMYVPWESGVNNQGNQTDELPWTEAVNTPCPRGYRMPDKTELFELFGDGVGVVPGSWTYKGERISASEVTADNKQININGISGIAKYLRLSGSKGESMYIPYGGTKSSISPSPKDPLFEQGFRLWCSDEKNGLALSIYYGNLVPVETNIKSFKVSGVDKESYAYVRCIKDSDGEH